MIKYIFIFHFNLTCSIPFVLSWFDKLVKVFKNGPSKIF